MVHIPRSKVSYLYSATRLHLSPSIGWLSSGAASAPRAFSTMKPPPQASCAGAIDLALVIQLGVSRHRTSYSRVRTIHPSDTDLPSSMFQDVPSDGLTRTRDGQLCDTCILTCRREIPKCNILLLAEFLDWFYDSERFISILGGQQTFTPLLS